MRERNCIGNNKVDQQKQKKSFYKRTYKKNIWYKQGGSK